MTVLLKTNLAEHFFIFLEIIILGERAMVSIFICPLVMLRDIIRRDRRTVIIPGKSLSQGFCGIPAHLAAVFTWLSRHF